jgi:hypothetical protein
MAVPRSAWGRVNSVSRETFLLILTLILVMGTFLAYVFPLARERTDFALYALSFLLLMVVLFGAGILASKVVFRPEAVEHKFFGVTRKRIEISQLDFVKRKTTIRGTPYFEFFEIGRSAPYRLIDFYDLQGSLVDWMRMHGKTLSESR